MNHPLVPLTARGILFDCDGTLVDTMPLHWAAIHETLGRHGVAVPQSYLEPFAGVPMELIVHDINKTFGATLNPITFSQQKEDLLFDRLHQCTPIDEIVAVARHYHKQLPMGIVSGGARKNVQRSLEAIGIADLFDVLVTCDDDVRPKPAPDIFLEGARRLCVEPRFCHVFEDADAGVTAAQAAGMTITDVRNVLSGRCS